LIDYDFNPTRKDLQAFARFVPAALIVVATGFGLIKGFMTFNLVFYGIAVILYLWGLIFLYSLKPIYLVWMVITRTIAFLVTTLVLSLVFYIGFTVIGLIMRLLGKNPLDRKFDRNADSYWIRRDPYSFSQEHYERQF